MAPVTKFRSILAAIIVVCASLWLGLHSDPLPPPVPPFAEHDSVPDFRLLDERGDSRQLSYYLNRAAVVLIVHGIGCPIVRKYGETIRDLNAEYSKRNVLFLMINANLQDTPKMVEADAREFNYSVPILLDEAQLVSRALSLTRTAEAIVINPKTRSIVYRGAIDDRLDYESERPTVKYPYLKSAVEATLQGQTPERAQTEPRGCLITYASPSSPGIHDISFTRDIAPIFRNRCNSCHHVGGLAPFAFDSLAAVRGWSAMTREVVMNGRMPPWFADPHYGEFHDDISLSVNEKQRLISWINSGSPGDGGEDPLSTAPPPPSSSEWPLGTPDLILNLPEHEIPATGNIPYVYATVDLPFKSDQWVSAAVIKVGNPKVVHHAFATIQREEDLFDSTNRLENFFAVSGPGGIFEPPLPPDTGQLLPARSSLLFQIHYVSTGKVERDASQLGLYLLKKKPAHEFKRHSVYSTDFYIPPYAPSTMVTASTILKRPIRLYTLIPHMHYRGRAIRYTATYPDGKNEVLLSVPHFQFNWQREYFLKSPKLLPARTRIRCDGEFDNSPQNPKNPDPSKGVRYGLETTDEMFICYFGYIEASESGD